MLYKFGKAQNLKPYLQDEQRINFKKFPLKAGTRNSSGVMKEEGILFEDVDQYSFNEFYNYFVNFLNSR